MGFVYVMSNPCLPGIYKIGKTRNIEKRKQQLSKTSTPFPFVVEFYIESNSYDELESLVKLYLGNFRINKRREFFDADLNAIIDSIKAIAENLSNGIKYLPMKSISDADIDLINNRWIDDYEYTMG